VCEINVSVVYFILPFIDVRNFSDPK